MSRPVIPGNPGVEREAGAAGEVLVLRRVWIFSVAAFVLVAPYYIARNEWKSLLGFSCSAAVVMINFRWLEEIVTLLLQPAPRKRWRLAVRPLARFVLFGVALSIALFVAKFDALSVLLGFSVLVAGILAEAVYSVIDSFRN